MRNGTVWLGAALHTLHTPLHTLIWKLYKALSYKELFVELRMPGIPYNALYGCKSTSMDMTLSEITKSDTGLRDE